MWDIYDKAAFVCQPGELSAYFNATVTAAAWSSQTN
jgi:hypothetical protein